MSRQSGGEWIEPAEGHMLDSARWAISSVVERFLHTEEATGSIPVSPTTSQPIGIPRISPKTLRWCKPVVFWTEC